MGVARREKRRQERTPDGKNKTQEGERTEEEREWRRNEVTRYVKGCESERER